MRLGFGVINDSPWEVAIRPGTAELVNHMEHMLIERASHFGSEAVVIGDLREYLLKRSVLEETLLTFALAFLFVVPTCASALFCLAI